jgi:hypothetical protein
MQTKTAFKSAFCDRISMQAPANSSVEYGCRLLPDPDIPWQNKRQQNTLQKRVSLWGCIGGAGCTNEQYMKSNPVEYTKNQNQQAH